MSVIETATTNREEFRRNGRVALVGLLVIQLLVGYEWFMSGLTKLYRGGFPGGLAAELRGKSQGAAGWYRSFLDGSIIPNATAFGYVLEIGELLVGIALIAAAVVWLLRYERLPDRGRVAVLATVIAASLAGVFMAVNFHIANGAPQVRLGIVEVGFGGGHFGLHISDIAFDAIEGLIDLGRLGGVVLLQLIELLREFSMLGREFSHHFSGLLPGGILRAVSWQALPCASSRSSP